MRLSDHAREVLATHDGTYATVRTYASTLQTWILPALGARPVDTIQRRDVDALLADVREAGRKAATVRMVLSTLRIVMRKAVEWGRATVNPTDGVRVRGKAALPCVLSSQHAAALEGVLRESRNRTDGLLLLLLGTGLRISEGLAVRPVDFDRERLVLRVLDSKTPSGVREVDVPDRFAGLVLGFRGITPQAARRRLRAACEAAGVPSIRVHDLRHTRATALLLAGAPAIYVCRQLGHSSPAFTMSTYGHVAAALPEQRRDWANRA